jgi:putative serine/threonine protein kinase
LDYKYVNDIESINLLCYPDIKSCDYNKKIDEMERHGLKYICNYGNLTIFNKKLKSFRILGKGHSSLVFLAYFKNMGVKAVKVRRVDSKRKSLVEEAIKLIKTSKFGVSPKVYYYSDDFIVMEYVGMVNLEYIIKNLNFKEAKNYMLESINTARLLDKIGILHSELSRPWRNIFFPSFPVEFPAIIIDLESSSNGCGNVNKIVGSLLNKMGITNGKERINMLLSSYKKGNCNEIIFNEIKKELISLFNSIA